MPGTTDRHTIRDPALRGDAPDSRPARREALQAATVWLGALIVTVGLSTWLGAAQGRAYFGVPGWALVGILLPWIAFFVMHVWICRQGAADEPPE